MKIEELLQHIDYTLVDRNNQEITDAGKKKALLATEITEITNDSRKGAFGVLFFCIVGAVSDGHNYAAKAALQGTTAMLVQHDVDWSEVPDDQMPVLIRMENTRKGMALISAAFYGHPAKRLKMIGITGTKGKTTTTYLVKSILEHAGVKMGLIGTIESTYGDVHVPAVNTTPESIVLQRQLKEMADAGVEAVVMEVSSQAFKLDRTAGIVYDLGVFTNISPDHIGPAEHESLEEYIACQGMLFKQGRVGIVNGDDKNTVNVLEGHTCEVETYGFNETNDLYAANLELVKRPGELGVLFDAKGLVNLRAEVPTPGRFSVYNALCAIAICRHFNVTNDVIASALLQAHVKGRIEMVKVSDDFTLMIDYAHNAVALESLLTTLKEYEPHRLVTVFGCGGNRSKLRRFEMGEVSGNLSDFTIITSDNPRFEEPEASIDDIDTGIKKTSGTYIRFTDRKEAIAYAIHHGEPGDIVVLAGKGHEDYQEIEGVKHPMDERVIIAEILAEDAKA